MKSNQENKLFVLSNCDDETINTYLPCIEKRLQEITKDVSVCTENILFKEMITIDCVGGTALDGVCNLSQYYMSLCRKYELLPNERATLLSSMDQLIALQLCLAEKNKKERGEFEVETSTVVQTNKDIVGFKMAFEESKVLKDYQDFLKHCNYVDMCDIHLAVHKALESNKLLRKEIKDTDILLISLPNNDVERAMVNDLSLDRVIQRVVVEVPLEKPEETTLEAVSVVITDLTLDDVLCVEGKTGFSQASPRTGSSVTQSYVQLVFVSYLELLVNSRSELALARSINTPERELTHTAFTDLKHEASTKGMTMFQTAVSFIMKLRLGGKGYAPDADHPLAQHVKGLGEFVTLVHKLQTIIEEDLDKRSSCRRVLNVIKKEIVKCKENRLRVNCVESVCASLQTEVINVINMLDRSPPSSSPNKAIRDGGSMVGRHTLKVLRYIVDKLASGMDKFKMQTIDFLCDSFSSQATPVRFPCILSQFTSPDEDDGESPDSKYNKSLSDRLLNKDTPKGSTPVYQKRFKSSMSWAQPSSLVDTNKEEKVLLSSRVTVETCKTIVQPKETSHVAKRVAESLNDQENITQVVDSPAKIITKNAEKGQKRKLTKPSSSQAKKSKTQDKPCRRKLLPQVKGQQQLTKFFRV